MDIRLPDYQRCRCNGGHKKQSNRGPNSNYRFLGFAFSRIETESTKGGNGSVPSETNELTATVGNNTKIYPALISERTLEGGPIRPLLFHLSRAEASRFLPSHDSFTQFCQSLHF